MNVSGSARTRVAVFTAVRLDFAADDRLAQPYASEDGTSAAVSTSVTCVVEPEVFR